MCLLILAILSLSYDNTLLKTSLIIKTSISILIDENNYLKLIIQYNLKFIIKHKHECFNIINVSKWNFFFLIEHMSKLN